MNGHITTLGALTHQHKTALSLTGHHLSMGASQAVAWVLIALFALAVAGGVFRVVTR